MIEYNLMRQGWVPVITGGQRSEVSLRDALLTTNEIDGLALDNPLETVALLRQVLLPIVIDALGPPTSEQDWSARWAVGTLDTGRLGQYLDKHEDRFDLFHPEHPFAQVAGLHTAKDETKPVSLLIASAATGNNVPLFSSRTEADPPPLHPAEAARALLAAQCWDTAAIKSGAVGDPQVKVGKTVGNPTGPLGQLGVVVPWGRTLAETLLLNIPIMRQGLQTGDRPAWRAEPASPGWSRRPCRGLLDLLTWQSRRIRLIHDQIDSCADGDDMRVRRVVVAAGDRLDPLPLDIELHTAWQRPQQSKPGDPSHRPARHIPGRSAWRGMAPLLATATAPQESDRFSSSVLLRQIEDLRAEGHLPPDLLLQVLTVGVAYGNQSAVVEDVMSDMIPLPMMALDPTSEVRAVIEAVVMDADNLRQAANRLGDDLRQAAGGDKLPWDRSQRLGEVLVHQFTPVVRRMLAGLQREPGRADAAAEAWRMTARRTALEVAEHALNTAPPTAFLGRGSGKDVARVAVAERRYQAAVSAILGPPADAAATHAALTKGA